MSKPNRLRRALRAINNFTLVTLNANPSSPYRDPHTAQATKAMSGTRVF